MTNWLVTPGIFAANEHANWMKAGVPGWYDYITKEPEKIKHAKWRKRMTKGMKKIDK